MQEVFGKFGEVARMVLPDTRTLALIEMADAAAARKAFRGAAYKGLHHVPLFLEWAPQGIFTPQAATLQDAQVSADPRTFPSQLAVLHTGFGSEIGHPRASLSARLLHCRKHS